MDRPIARHERIEQDAADWLAALDTGQADRAAFEAWRAADAAHAIAFIRVQSAWRKLDRLGREPAAAAEDPEIDQARPSRRRALAAAATAVALGAGSAVFVASRTVAQTVETAIGERRRFYVADKVCLDLNTAGRLRWWKTKEAIEIDLQRGEVSLDLSQGAPHCLLSAGNVRLSIDHGRCVARLHPDDAVDIIALSNAVHLLPRRGEARSMIVPAREKLVARTDGMTLHALSDSELRAATAWQEGELLLDGEPLSIAVAEFNRYLPTPMVLENPEMGRLRLGGRFLTNDPAEFLHALRANFGIHAQMEQSRIVLTT